MKTSNEIRNDFLQFFRGKGHEIVPSAPLVPGNDPSLLFTNAGMVQFKDVFLGGDKRSYTRAASSQRCLRAGGKHNDLDSVGYTARHHTFFEMLGNFSFGDYFKRDAIRFAWELLTSVWGLSSERLLVTIYHTDDQAFDLWHGEVGLPASRIIRIGDKGAAYASDNFWQMADTGPCGPCSEVFYDHGAHIAGGPPGSPGEDGDRFIEIWNLVFMQFDRQPDGGLVPLPAPCVDTGMGLERLSAVLQQVHSNYETDLFQALIAAAADFTATADRQNKSLRVIADHIRACSFLIVDGVLPSNEGRGYVLRRIIRRALRHGWMLGVRASFFFKMVAPLVGQMGVAYPELAAKQGFIESALRAEEERFAQTLDQGMRIFDDVAARARGTIPGADAFRLYDTYGFPVDLTGDIARERGLSVDMAGFDVAMTQQRERAREASKFVAAGNLPSELIAKLQPTQFLGYEDQEADACRIVMLLKDGVPVERIEAGDAAVVVLDRTPFYAESGGQVGDTGMLLDPNADQFAVSDTQKFSAAFVGHIGQLQAGRLLVGQFVSARIDSVRRQAIVLNHSATHLLHAALRHVLGAHVQQKGSLVAADRLRFDFAHFQPIGATELACIEDLVNTEIRRNHEAEVHQMSMHEALEFGAMALFGEKYGERVRVLKMGGFSIELCGGTHVQRAGDIGLFKIVSESGISAGVRRIEAVSGRGALERVVEQESRLAQSARLLGGNSSELVEKLKQLVDRQKRLEKELESLKAKAAADATLALAATAHQVGSIRVVAARIEGLDGKALREGVDVLKNKLGDAVILLAAAAAGKVALVAGVSGTALGRIKAGDVVSEVAKRIGGKGGGRADMAQGGGDDGPALHLVLADLPAWIGAQLG